MTIRCLLVDDNRRFLRTAKDLLERDQITVVGVASTSPQALQQAAELHPDVVLIDIALGAELGFDLARALTRTAPAPPRMIMVSAYLESDFADMIATSPAIGFLSKTDLSGSAIQALVKDADTAN